MKYLGGYNKSEREFIRLSNCVTRETREKKIYIIIFVILYSGIDIFSDMSTVIYNNYVNLRKAALTSLETRMRHN